MRSSSNIIQHLKSVAATGGYTFGGYLLTFAIFAAVAAAGRW